MYSLEQLEGIIEMQYYLNFCKKEKNAIENIFYYTKKFLGIIVRHNFIEQSVEYKIKKFVGFFIKSDMKS